MYWIVLLLSANVFATTGWILEVKSRNEFIVKNVSYEGNCEYQYVDLHKSIISNLLLCSWYRYSSNSLIRKMVEDENDGPDEEKNQDMRSMKLGAFLLNKHTSQGDPEAIKLLHKILKELRSDGGTIIGYTSFKEFQTETTDVNLRKIGDAETEIKSAQELREAILRLYPDLKDEIEAMLPKTWNGWFSSKFNEASGYISSMFSSSRPCNHGYKKL